MYGQCAIRQVVLHRLRYWSEYLYFEVSILGVNVLKSPLPRGIADVTGVSTSRQLLWPQLYLGSVLAFLVYHVLQCQFQDDILLDNAVFKLKCFMALISWNEQITWVVNYWFKFKEGFFFFLFTINHLYVQRTFGSIGVWSGQYGPKTVPQYF